MSSSDDQIRKHFDPIANSEPYGETSALLPKGGDESGNSTSQEEGELFDVLDEDTTSKTHLIRHEFWVLTKGSIPVIMAYTLQNSLQTISILIVGQASPQDLSTAAFSYMFAMCTGWLIGMGGSTALDTLASSSFTGSKSKHDLGILLQRSFIVLGLFYVPVAVLWLFSEPLFLALGQNEALSRDSAKFLTCLIPGGLGYIYFEAMKKYLQAQEIMRPGTYVLLITSPISALLNWLFVYKLGWGIFSAPFATGIGYWLSFLGLVLYTRFVAGSECWGGWTKKSLHNMGTFAKLAILGVVHVGTEWWAFEIVALAAGRLGEIPLASQSVIMTADQVHEHYPVRYRGRSQCSRWKYAWLEERKGCCKISKYSSLAEYVHGRCCACYSDGHTKCVREDLQRRRESGQADR